MPAILFITVTVLIVAIVTVAGGILIICYKRRRVVRLPPLSQRPKKGEQPQNEQQNVPSTSPATTDKHHVLDETTLHRTPTLQPSHVRPPRPRPTKYSPPPQPNTSTSSLTSTVPSPVIRSRDGSSRYHTATENSPTNNSPVNRGDPFPSNEHHELVVETTTQQLFSRSAAAQPSHVLLPVNSIDEGSRLSNYNSARSENQRQPPPSTSGQQHQNGQHNDPTSIASRDTHQVFDETSLPPTRPFSFILQPSHVPPPQPRPTNSHAYTTTITSSSSFTSTPRLSSYHSATDTTPTLFSPGEPEDGFPSSNEHHVFQVETMTQHLRSRSAPAQPSHVPLPVNSTNEGSPRLLHLKRASSENPSTSGVALP
ncbi:uncharacterized protein LOC143853956 isoform X1 [Tasmannia lanceolata]|uniref:uncharacterized protein LOC143853956 isoform X1 n=1 Tax=Tasmannia lanceolata TaxID=3420 RepID=UPI004062D3F3